MGESNANVRLENIGHLIKTYSRQKRMNSTIIKSVCEEEPSELTSNIEVGSIKPIQLFK